MWSYQILIKAEASDDVDNIFGEKIMWHWFEPESNQNLNTDVKLCIYRTNLKSSNILNLVWEEYPVLGTNFGQ